MTNNQNQNNEQPAKTSPGSQGKGTTGNSQKATQSTSRTEHGNMGPREMKKPLHPDRKSSSKWSDEDQDSNL